MHSYKPDETLVMLNNDKKVCIVKVDDTCQIVRPLNSTGGVVPLEFNYTEVDYEQGYKIWPPLKTELVNNTKNKTICTFRVDDSC